MINTDYSGNISQPVVQTLGGTTTTKIGDTAANSTAVLAAFSFVNTTVGSVNCFLYWYNATATTEYLIWTGAVAAGESKIVDSIPVKLRKGDEIRAKGASGVVVALVYTQAPQSTSK